MRCGDKTRSILGHLMPMVGRPEGQRQTRNEATARSRNQRGRAKNIIAERFFDS